MVNLFGCVCAFILGFAAADPRACSQPKYLPGVYNVTISSGGHERIFTLYVPRMATNVTNRHSPLVPPHSPVPLVMNWHGFDKLLNGPVMDFHIEITKVIDEAQERTSQLQPWYAI